ncbi:MAG: hypothetical protein OK456_03950 [Thaumarchaeota archaeon]|nr:hypothetical protein [Nitrososphaerota archaeon]
MTRVRFRRARRGISEIVASVAMLVITMAVLGGLGVLSLGSLHNAAGDLVSGSHNEAESAGVLLRVVSTQSNSSGTYVWLFDYGWNPATLSSVYVNGGILSGWSSSCSPLQVKSMCSLALPSDTHGAVSILFGTNSVALSL